MLSECDVLTKIYFESILKKECQQLKILTLYSRRGEQVKQEINVSARENLKSAYEKYYASLYNFCFLRLKNEEQASDCVQDSFCVFYDRLLRGEEILNPGGYLYKTANNLVKAQFRQNKKEQGFLQLDAIENIAGKESGADFSGIDYDALAQKVLSALDEKEQEIYKKAPSFIFCLII